MRLYCKNCGSEFIAGDKKPKQGVGIRCPQCDSGEPMVKIPDYETPEQYKERTGEEYFDHGLCFIKIFESITNSFRYAPIGYAVAKRTNKTVVIASPPVPPPDDWEP